MKKILIAFFSLVLLFGAQGALATSFWNGLPFPTDCQTVAVGNYTTGTGIQNGQQGCWTLSSVNASPGDYINVQIYYHNTSGSTTATNTKLVMTAPTGSSTSHSFTGQIVSDQASTSAQSVTVNLPSSQTLTFSSTYWYPNQTTTAIKSYTPEILNGGLSIGSIAPGWGSQGSVVVSFLVGSTTPPPPQNCIINSFTASPNSITSGQSSNLNWSTSNCTSASISTLGNVNTSGSQMVYPTYTTTYILTAYGSQGQQVTQQQTVTVNQQVNNCVINNFTASPNSITSGQSSTLNWSTSNCTSANISTVGSVNTSGSQIVYPTYTTTYILTALGSQGQQVTQQQTVTVNQQVNNCVINNFTASPNSITSGQSSMLNWGTSNCTSATISNLNYSVSVSGSQVVYPTYTTTYVLTAVGSQGQQVTQQQTVTVGNQYSNCYISYFTVNNQQSVTIQSGALATLAWSVSGNNYNSNCTVSITGPNFTGSGLNGSQTIYPNYSGTYTLTVYGSGSGNQTQSVYVNVTNNQYNNCTISSFTASPTSINYGGVSILNWSTNNCTSVSISNIGTVNAYGSQSVYPVNTTTYTLSAYGSGGYPVTQSVQVNVNNYVPTPTPVNNACAVTSVATNVTSNSVTLNGIISGTNLYSNTNSYFEYGRSVYLGSQTSSRSSNGSTIFSDTLTGLSPSTIYYFRFDSNCGNGISNGSINIFQTLGNQVNYRTIIRQGTTVVGTESPIMLTIEDRYQSIRLGDEIDYVVTYKNIGNKKLGHILLQVILPKGIAYVNSSQGTFSSDTYTVSVPLQDLNPGDGGQLFVTGRVDSLDPGNAQVVTTALLVYTNPKGAQENAIAYVLNNPFYQNNNNLAGLAFLGWFFNLGILGWMMLIIIILLIILLSRRYYERRVV